MGTVFHVDQDLIRRHANNSYYDPGLHHYVSNGHWSRDCDTCCFKHTDESKDELCIKDPARQIFLYGLHEELSSSLCGCI